MAENHQSRKRPKLPKGTLAGLVAREITKFEIKGDFGVSRKTVHSRIKAGCLVVWDTGIASPVILVEMMLATHIIKAWS